MISYEESRRVRSAGRLVEDVEAKVVDNDTGELLSVGQTGELYLRGSSVMIGNQYYIVNHVSSLKKNV